MYRLKLVSFLMLLLTACGSISKPGTITGKMPGARSPVETNKIQQKSGETSEADKTADKSSSDVTASSKIKTRQEREEAVRNAQFFQDDKPKQQRQKEQAKQKKRATNETNVKGDQNESNASKKQMTMLVKSGGK